MLSNATNQPKSTVEVGYMCPRGLTGPPAVAVLVSVFSPLQAPPPRGDAGGLSREYVLRIPSVS